MRLESLIDYISEALENGDAHPDTPVLVIRRDMDFELDSEEAWQEAPIQDVQVDGDDVDIIEGDLGSASLDVGELLARLSAIEAGADERFVYARGKTVDLGAETFVRIDSPVLAFTSRPADGVVGLIVKFEGWEEVFEE
ncbi:MAG: hypothetical protein AB2L09_08170 [Coriobacteriia bacterium]